ncbi:hypothetical protein, partial [Dactylosporangium aurantiacum]|uniref:hypothetical protein n=1 Tax=Dactylosporangium aurantiacum TaxID=35754 RepID=UPI0036BBDC1A
MSAHIDGGDHPRPGDGARPRPARRPAPPSGPRPFVGSGEDTGTWGTALRLLRADRDPLHPT